MAVITSFRARSNRTASFRTIGAELATAKKLKFDEVTVGASRLVLSGKRFASPLARYLLSNSGVRSLYCLSVTASRQM